MNYRHDFHAGNFADVFKHIILVRILLHLVKKEAPFRYIDTHAGSGLYNLFGTEAARTGEWRQGLGRFMAVTDVPPALRTLIEPYMQLAASAVRQDAAGLYPGSPAIASALLRAQDRMMCCELHPAAARELQDYFARERRAKIIAIDGFIGLNAFIPPIERRGIVLIDPAYEAKDELDHSLKRLEAAWRKWSTGIFMFWYPVKDQRQADTSLRRFEKSQIKRVLRIELQVADPMPDGRLVANGVLIVNPPFTLLPEAELILPYLVETMAEERGANHRIEWLSGA